jgi:protease IV
VSFNHTLSSILRGKWFIEPQWAIAHLPTVLSILKGNPVSFGDRTGNQGIELPFAIDPRTMQRYNWLDGRNPNIPDNAVGILPISGPITKYNGDCGEPGAIQRNSWLMQMQSRASIGSVVMLLDTPGGEARAASTLAPTISNFKKPILSYIDGLNASLGMWLSSGTDEVYLSNKMDELGSIGTYVTIPDFTGYFEKEGIKLHEIYAPQSVDKNKDYRDAIKGDYASVEKDLKLLTDEFIGFVKNQRGDKAAASIKEWSSGKMFYADEAVSLGLADGIRSFDQVISKAAWLAQRNKS